MTPVQEVKAPNRRLDSWKEIAAFFGRDERTVKRWEKERALPIHRFPGGSRARVFAFTDELERWMRSVDPLPGNQICDTQAADEPARHNSAGKPEASFVARKLNRHRLLKLGLAAAVLLIAGAVLGFALHHRPAREVQARATNPEAQELYLQGRYYWNKRTPQDLNKAVDAFTQAIVHDPSYAQAYIGLADCYNLLREFAAMPEREAYPRALAAAKKAVELDDSSAEAHASLAFVEFYWNWDVQRAEREFRRAIKLNPEYAVAHQWYANFLAMSARAPEALEEISRAEQIDPGSNAIVADRALVFFELGRDEEAIAILKGVEDSQPGFYASHRYLSYIYFSRRDFSDFITESMKSAELSQDAMQLEIARAAELGYRSGGERGMLQRMLNVYERLYQNGQGSPYMVAVSYARLNENDKAIQYLQTAYEQHDALFLNIAGDKSFLLLHNDPNFRQLERRSGLPPLT